MITIPFAYTYLALGVALGIVWVASYILYPVGRKRQLAWSALSIVLLPIELIFTRDYWRPPEFLSVDILGSYLSVADLLFAATFCGVAAVLPLFFFREDRPQVLAFSNAVTCAALAAVLTISFSLLSFWL